MRQPQDLRRRNRQDVVFYLLSEAALTRPQLAELTGLSKVTVNAIVQELVFCGVAEMTGGQGGLLGRNPRVVRLHSQAGVVAALDVQPPCMQFQLLDLRGQAIQKGEVSYAAPDVTAILAEHIRKLKRQKHGPLRHVVLGLPAPIDASGEVAEPNALTELDVPALRQALERTKVPWSMENDANLVALAVARECPDFSHLAALVERESGTGLGLILDGELYRGSHGRAGELGRSRWPTHGRAEYLEQLPVPERSRATAFLLASLVQTLDLQHVVLGLPAGGAETLRRELTLLLGSGVTFSSQVDVDSLALTGAACRAVEAGQRALLQHLETLPGGIGDVA